MGPLSEFTLSFVPLIIAIYKQKGGPSEKDFERMKPFSLKLGEQGDALFFKKENVTSQLANMWLDAIAVLSFLPGGVTVFGHCFESGVVRQQM